MSLKGRKGKGLSMFVIANTVSSAAAFGTITF